MAAAFRTSSWCLRVHCGAQLAPMKAARTPGSASGDSAFASTPGDDRASDHHRIADPRDPGRGCAIVNPEPHSDREVGDAPDARHALRDLAGVEIGRAGHPP